MCGTRVKAGEGRERGGMECKQSQMLGQGQGEMREGG